MFWIGSALVFSLLSVLCVSWAGAAFRAHQTENMIADWGATGYIEDEKDMEVLFRLVSESERALPSNPRHILNRATLLEWRAQIQRLYPGHAKKNLRLALEGYYELNQLMPSSGFVWASIAEKRARLSQFDDETTRAIHLAARFGPLEIPAQRRIIQAGIKHWRKWPEPTRQLVAKIITDAFLVDMTLQRRPMDRFIYSTTIRNDWDDNLLGLLPNEKTRQWFEQFRKATRSRYSG